MKIKLTPYITIVIIILLSPSCITINNKGITKEIITWKETRKLKWTDFAGYPNESSLYEAVASVKLNVNYKIEKQKLKFRVFAMFSKKESWYKSTPFNDTEYHLNHEQKHFDLGEVVALELKNELFSYSLGKKEVLNEFPVEKIIDEYLAKLRVIEKQYDSETNHSLDYINQIKWDSIIYRKLDSLSQYGASYSL